jgi:hypothetical protein
MVLENKSTGDQRQRRGDRGRRRPCVCGCRRPCLPRGTHEGLEKVASDIGDTAGVGEVDVLDERAVAVAADSGGIDIALDAVAFPFVHSSPVADLAVEDIVPPIEAFLRANVNTAQSPTAGRGALSMPRTWAASSPPLRWG